MNAGYTITAVALAAFLTGCSSETEKPAEAAPKAEVFDVQYYLNNAQARRQMLVQCQDNPGALEDTANCVNATEAAKQVRRQEMRDAINKG